MFTLTLRELTVHVGANGAGKTTLLDTFLLLAASASGRLSERLSDRGGIESKLTKLSVSKVPKLAYLALQLAMPVLKLSPLESRPVIHPKGVSYVIADEQLSQKRKKKLLLNRIGKPRHSLVQPSTCTSLESQQNRVSHHPNQEVPKTLHRSL